MRSFEQLRDDVEVVHAQDVHVRDVHDLEVERDVTHVAAEVVKPDALVADDVVHPNVVVANEVAGRDPVSSATADKEVTTLMTEPSVHNNGAFSGGSINWSVLTM